MAVFDFSHIGIVAADQKTITDKILSALPLSDYTSASANLGTTMGYAELIKTLENLPPERRAEVFDFAEFLAARCNQDQQAAPGSGTRPLAEFLNAPLAVKEPFRPLSRDEIYDRAGLR